MISYEFLTINSFVTRSLVVSHPASYRPSNFLEGISIILEYTGYIIEIELTFSELRVILVNLKILLRRCSHIIYS